MALEGLPQKQNPPAHMRAFEALKGPPRTLFAPKAITWVSFRYLTEPLDTRFVKPRATENFTVNPSSGSLWREGIRPVVSFLLPVSPVCGSRMCVVDGFFVLMTAAKGAITRKP